MLEKCEICPRNCLIDKDNGKLGFCQSDNDIQLGLVSLHHWEEPCISGKNGSGTIFFSNCNLKCCFCQNHEISQQRKGRSVNTEQLTEILLKQQERGAHNINLVTPTHYTSQIISAVKQAKLQGLHIPIIYNTNSYEEVASIYKLNGYVDVYLPDLKYYNDQHARKYSQAPNYFFYASKAIQEMVSQVGAPIFNEAGLIKKGVIIRHLILPGLIDDSKKIIEYVFNTFGNLVYLSLMNQYTPMHFAHRYPEINRTVTDHEYQTIINYALSIGIENCFVQEGDTSSKSYVPDFNFSGF